MKKIFKHLCLCLCLVMVGLLCFNAKPKAVLFDEIISSVNYDVPYDFEENSYLWVSIFSCITPSTTDNIKFYYQKTNNEIVNIPICSFNSTHTTITYYDYYSLSTHTKSINNVNTSFFGFFVSNIFKNANLYLRLQLIQFDYTKSNLIDDTDITTLNNAFTEIYNYDMPANSLLRLDFKNDFSFYYNEMASMDIIYNLVRDNYMKAFYLIWNYYNSDMEGIGIGDTISSFYNYSYDEYSKGIDEGLELGFDLGVASIENIPGTFLTPIFDFIDNVFNLEVIPNVKIGYFIIIPLVFGVLGVVLYFWRKD